MGGRAAEMETCDAGGCATRDVVVRKESTEGLGLGRLAQEEYWQGILMARIAQFSSDHSHAARVDERPTPGVGNDIEPRRHSMQNWY